MWEFVQKEPQLCRSSCSLNGFSAEVWGSKVGVQVANAEKGNFEEIKSLLLSAAPIHSDEANWLGLVLDVAV